jgi:hypothetical protein
VRSPIRSEPFQPLPDESVPALFWQVLLRCGVLAGFGCGVMLWGLRGPLIAIGTLVAVTVIVAVTAHSLPGVPSVGRAAWLAARSGVTLTAAGAVVQLAGLAGLVVVVLSIVLTPAARTGLRRVWDWCVGLRDTVDAPAR